MKLNVTIELDDRHYQDPAAYLGIVLQHLADAAYWNDETGGHITDPAGRSIGEWSLTDDGRPPATPAPSRLHPPPALRYSDGDGPTIQ